MGALSNRVTGNPGEGRGKHGQYEGKVCDINTGFLSETFPDELSLDKAVVIFIC